MSDKSVRKVLDWPSHRVGSKPSDPVRFEEGEEFNPAISEGFEAMGDEECEVHQKTYNEHSLDELDEDVIDPDKEEDEVMQPDSKQIIDTAGSAMSEVSDLLEDLIRLEEDGQISTEEVDEVFNYAKSILGEAGMRSIGKGEQGDASTGEGWQGQGQADLSQQLNPTTEQNVSPYTQSQFVPTGTQMTAPTGKGEAGQEPIGIFTERCQSCGGTGVNEMTGGKCTYCRGQGRTPKYEEDAEFTGEAHFTQEEHDILSHEGRYAECPMCFPQRDWESKTYGEQLPDPREREKIAKQPDRKQPELSPEAQKIAGTDPATQQAKEKSKPKLEVDVSDKITILGKTGSGKTNLIKVLLSDILKDYQFVLLDALGNFAEYEGQANIDYHQVTPSDQAGVDEILYAALEKGNCMVVMDEVDRYSSKPGSMLNELVNVGRNYGVGGIFAARRTADVNKDVLANSPYIFTFQHILPQDLDVLIDWFSQDETVFRDLQEYEAILFHNGEQMWQGKVPEKPTTKPTAKPTPPKKPKGKDKGKEPEPEKGKEPEGKPKEKGPPTPPIGEGGDTKGQVPSEPEEPPEKGPPEEEPEEPEEKSEVAPEFYWLKDEEGAFKCDQCGESFKYQKDFLNHVPTHAGR